VGFDHPRTSVTFFQDVRTCTEALQAIQKEKGTLEASTKDLTDGRDALEEKKMTKNELALKREVRE
jgi:cell division protein FtsB